MRTKEALPHVKPAHPPHAHVNASAAPRAMDRLARATDDLTLAGGLAQGHDRMLADGRARGRVARR